MIKFGKLSVVSLIALLTGIYSCSESTKDGVNISGKIDGYSNKVITIRSSEINDSITSNADGSFEYASQITEPTYFRFMGDGPQKSLILLVEPNEQIEVAVSNVEDWQKTYTVSGSEGSAKLFELNTHYLTSLSALEDVRTEYNSQMKNVLPASEEYKTITEIAGKQYDSIVGAERLFLESFVTQNLNSLASISALYQTFDYRTGRPILLDTQDGMQYFEMVDSALSAKYPTLKDVQSFHQNVIQIKTDFLRQKENEAVAQKSLLNIGDEAPEISMSTPDGKQLSLKSLRGKVVLLDFWASWCAPCRVENPAIVKAYKEFNSKGFEIYQVSLDKNKKAWTDAIQKDGLVWKNHVSDLLFWNSAAAKTYGVQSIPANFLLNKEGKVIAKNLRGEELFATLNEIL